MTLEELQGAVDIEIDVPMHIWAAASLIGAARTKSNDRVRLPQHDRSQEKNEAGDVFGVVAELLLLRIVETLPSSEEACASLRSNAFDPRGGSSLDSHPDLIFSDQGTDTKIDAKSYSCKPNYNYFAISDNKHKNLDGQCDQYFATIVPLFGKRAIVSKLIPYRHVNDWKERKLTSQQNPNPNLARVLRIEDFIKNYCKVSVDLPALRRNVYSEDDINELKSAEEFRAKLIAEYPSLEGHLI